MPTVKIGHNYVTRIEGHGVIAIKRENGKVAKCQWQVPEAPRFFEAIVVGHSWDELTPIVSRICGICSVSHTLVSLQAIEAALGITISKQTRLLRQLLEHAENLQSHILHIGYLVLPDLLGTGSVLPLSKTHPEVLQKAIGCHRLANEICEIVGGRTTHPVRAKVGGFSAIPEPDELNGLRLRLASILDPLKTVAQLLKTLLSQLPCFERETEYIALISDDEYALYDGTIGSSDTAPIPVDRYDEVINEYVVPWSTAKWVRHNRDVYMVGALARYNLSGHLLSPLAAEMACYLGLSRPCYNPFLNSIAQLVECFHSAERCISLIDQLLDMGLTNEEFRGQSRAGKGVAAVEAPRGLLIHEYSLDDQGKCEHANFVIPTNQNHANIQADFDEFVPTIAGQPEENVKQRLEMLVRAYDPCVSCSTH